MSSPHTGSHRDGAGNPDVPVVIASNRGPLSFSLHDGELVGRRGGGGLVSGLAPLVEAGNATWIAAAMSDADRMAARSGAASAEGLSVELLDLDPADQALHYDIVSNSTLWFLHHGLYDLTRDPQYDDAWWDAWAAYRRVNAAFAAAVADSAPRGAAVLVQDYHLTLLAPVLREERPDLRLVHFHHTPFAGPDGLRVLPPEARSEMLAGLAAHHATGFHTPGWARNHDECQRRFGKGTTTSFAASLNSDLDELRAVADSAACRAAAAELDELVGDAVVVARVDRMELSKNIVRGFRAWDLLLRRRPDLAGRTVFVAFCYPSRLGVPAYARYRDEVLAAVDEVNDRHGTADWQPIVLMTDDDYPRSVALLGRYDVLVVNPIRDGLNLVAKEGPLLNGRNGQLVLSTEAGAHEELGTAADSVDPFDLRSTAAAIEAALDRGEPARSERSTELARAAARRTPADWLADQLAQLP